MCDQHDKNIPTSGLLNALELDAVLEGGVDVLLHDQLHSVHLPGHRRQLVHLRQVVVLLANLLHQAAALLVQRTVLGGGGLVAHLGHELSTSRETRMNMRKVSDVAILVCLNCDQMKILTVRWSSSKHM